MAESAVKAKIKAILKSHGSRVAYYMPVQTGYGRHGIEDFCVCAYSIWLAVEAKDTERSTQSELQKLRQAEIKAAGGIYVVIHRGNLELLSRLLDRLKDRFEAAQQRKAFVCTSGKT